MAHRSKKGTFILKSETERLVRSIRATDWVWDEFGFQADSRRITRADLLERWVKGEENPPAAPTSAGAHLVEEIDVAIAVEILHEALTMKANAGGAIKKAIRQALDELMVEPSLPHHPPVKPR